MLFILTPTEQAGVGLLLGEQKDSNIVLVKQVVPRGSAGDTPSETQHEIQEKMATENSLMARTMLQIAQAGFGLVMQSCVLAARMPWGWV